MNTGIYRAVTFHDLNLEFLEENLEFLEEQGHACDILSSESTLIIHIMIPNIELFTQAG